MTLAANTPVIVGVGFEQERNPDPAACAEAVELMIRAAGAAAIDAGGGGESADDWAARIESVGVAQGIWSYRNPGRLIAEALGCSHAQSVLTGVGVLQLTLFGELCSAIASGRQRCGLVVGGEAKFRELRSLIDGTAVPVTAQPDDTPPPDIHLTSADAFCAELEAQRGLQSPVDFYAIIESALRFHHGRGVEEHRDSVAQLYAGFSQIAARNPRAWQREAVAADAIRDPGDGNAMLAFPYTKRHASQWNVNRAVAILVCSVEMADAFGVPETARVFPLSIGESRHVVPLAQQPLLHSRQGSVQSGVRAFALADLEVGDVDVADLYSCFPSAVQSFAHDLQLDSDTPWSVTGAMPFSGGPFNHSTLDGVARMTEVLRAPEPESDGRRVGLVTNLSAIFGKQACAIFSNTPGSNPFGYEDVTATVAERDVPIPLDGHYQGPATIVGYTVVFRGDTASHAIAICDVPGGKRTVVRSETAALLDAMTREEFCGRRVQVSLDGGFRV
jgi:acetyl-CoA C-acetyltransferase